jgi:hypothetical protein
MRGELMPWKYAPDEDPKRKHYWNQAYAGFVEVDGVQVGKCPNCITNEQAEVALNDGIPWHNPRVPKTGWPDRFYIVHGGVVYRAKPTNPGSSYHAFPELPSELNKLPRAVRDQIVARAQELGCQSEVAEWMRG